MITKELRNEILKLKNEMVVMKMQKNANIEKFLMKNKKISLFLLLMNMFLSFRPQHLNAKEHLRDTLEAGIIQK